MIHIHIEAESALDLRRQLKELLDLPGDTVAVAPSPPPEIPADECRQEEPVARPEPEVPVAQPEPEPEPAGPRPKMEDCRAALNALRSKHGPAAVRAILTAHGVSSFVDLPADDYASVIKEANDAAQ